MSKPTSAQDLGGTYVFSLAEPGHARMFLMLYLFETIEKILQTRTFINSREHWRSRKKRPVVNEFNLWLEHLIAQLDRDVCPAFRAVFESDEIDILKVGKIARSINNVVTTMVYLHNKLHLLAGQGKGENELTYDFVQKLVIDNRGDLPWESVWLQSMPAVTLTDTFNFVDYLLRDAFNETLGQNKLQSLLPSDREDIIALPKAEVDNPLMWGELAHEIAHIIIDNARLLDAIIDRSRSITNYEREGSTVQSTYRSHSREMCADLIAMRLLGPAYFCSFASITMLLSDAHTQSRQSSHPPIQDRSRALDKSNDLHDFESIKVTGHFESDLPHSPFPYQYNLFATFYVANSYKYKLWTDPATISLFSGAKAGSFSREGTVVLRAESELIESILDRAYVPICTLSPQEELIGMAKELDTGRPIASFPARLDKGEFQRTLNQISRKKKRTHDDYDKLQISEEPMNLANLLLAGWYKKIYFDYVKLLKMITCTKASSTPLSDILQNPNIEFGDGLSYNDILVQRNELLQISLSSSLMMQIYKYWSNS